MHDDAVSLSSMSEVLRGPAELLNSSETFLATSEISGIHSLPNELLARIFFFATRRNHINFPQIGSALHTSAVCRSWRDLAISCPELWSNFGVYLGGDPIDDEASDDEISSLSGYWTAQETAVDLYLARSQPHLLTLDISAPHLWGAGRDHPILSKLARSSARWQNVSLSLCVLDSDDSAYPALFDLDLPALESIDIIQQPEKDHLYGDLSILARATNLKLQNLSVTGCSISIPEDIDHILNNLTTLTYRSNSEDVYEILSLCPNLQTLSLSDPLSGDNQPYRLNTPCQLLQLTSLSVSVHCYHMNPNRDLLQCSIFSLTAPALTSLALHQCGRVLEEESLRIPGTFNALDSFLTRSGCALTRLVIDGLVLTDLGVVHFLKRLPCLEHFTIKDPVIPHPHTFPVTKRLFESFQIQTQISGTDHDDDPRSENSLESSHLVPKLHSLRVHVEHGSEFDPCSFMRMISSRWLPDETRASSLGVSCLREVELSFGYAVDNADYLALLNLSVQNQGLRVVVRRQSDCLSDSEDSDSYYPGVPF